MGNDGKGRRRKELPKRIPLENVRGYDVSTTVSVS